jgi:hypothetical protein
MDSWIMKFLKKNGAALACNAMVEITC